MTATHKGKQPRCHKLAGVLDIHEVTTEHSCYRRVKKSLLSRRVARVIDQDQARLALCEIEDHPKETSVSLCSAIGRWTYSAK